MISVILATVVTIVVGYFIIKKYKPHTILFTAGIFLMICAHFLNTGEILPVNKQTGFWLFDIFEYIKLIFQADAAGTGLTVMAVGGFAVYMEKIGASTAMVDSCVNPLKKLNAPYLVLALSYVVGQILNIFIPSATGLSILLMATMFPLLVELGVSRLSAAAIVGTASCLDLGPASGATNMAAQSANLDTMLYFVNYQLPVSLFVVITIATLHYLVQKYSDKKLNFVQIKKDTTKNTIEKSIPKAYCILPLLPLVFLFVFSKLVITSISMNVITAMFLGVAISMIFEVIFGKKEVKEVFKDLQIFFNGMGDQFSSVVTLIIAGQIFAKGLTSIGVIDLIIESCKNSGFGPIPMTIIMVIIITVCSIVMGSGNAPFYSFAALSPTIASAFGMPTVLMVMPMQLGSGIARSMSPITSVIVAVGKSANENPMDIVKRTAIPMTGGLIVLLIANFIVL